ncbi:plasminogen-binding N-terminal domain-containing protein [Helicobacter acinonychis]|uniref:Plasminogen binding protein n=1 Tax=Helicobacter acinonychis (strain Sheeba) TaxID=382638 RepID=Q17XE9_HELAH|nr:plasminogen-binding N-terminal domain-containing protein [Helicobacter acinonychis]CAJ99677.1 conserved hypothetical protein [Helicobacter acinonychis str. Sheeba]STP04240.1 plasminogen binding protein [Helicobacter acinonychis]
MLRRLIGLFLASFISLQSASWQEPLRVSVDFVDLPRKIIRFPAHDLKVGEFGFVVTKLSDYEVINSEVIIIAVENGVATARFKAFDSIKQSHLPTPRIIAKKGDLVYFRQFNNQAFLIAPNDAIYEQIKAANTDINFISSDLLVTFLNGFDPKMANLRKACNIYSVGVIYLVTTNTLNILNCESFEILEKRALDTSGVTKTSTPFFSRVEGIDAGTLGKLFSGSKSRNYFAYYDALVKKEKRKEVRIEKREEKVDARENKQEIKQEAIKPSHKEPKKANQNTENATQQSIKENNISPKGTQESKNAPTLEEKNYQKAEKKLDATEERRRLKDERKKAKAEQRAREFEQRAREHQEKDEAELEERRKALESNLKDERKKAKAEQRAREFEQRAREHQEKDEAELEERRKALESNKK